MSIDTSDNSFTELEGHLEDAKPATNDGMIGALIERIEGSESARIKKALAKGMSLYAVEATLPGGAMAGIQLFMLIEKLSEAGEVIITMPDGDIVSSPKFDGKITVLIAHEDKETLIELFSDACENVHCVFTSPDTLGVDDSEAIIVEDEGNQQVDFLIDKVENMLLDRNSVTMSGSESVASLQQIEEIKVKVGDLNKLFLLIEELVLIRNQYQRLNDTKDYGSLREITSSLDRTTNDLYMGVLTMRLTSLGQIFNMFKRKVSEMAEEHGKQVDFIIQGEEVSVDRTLLEELVDPLLGLLSNAVYHGIESFDERKEAKKILVGTVKLKAVHEEESVVITVEDDGRGINLEQVKRQAYKIGLVSQDVLETISDEEALNLITMPGFTTRGAEEKGSEMGLYAIKQRIESNGGAFDVQITDAQGTVFTMVMPTNMTIQRVLLFYIGGQIIATPQAMVQTIVPAEATVPKTYMGETALVEYRDEIIPVYDISKLLGIRDDVQVNYGIILNKRNKKLCVKVSEILGFEEVVIKSSEGNKMLDMPWLAGMTILSDGQASPILDIWMLIQQHC
ncbi:chemotaxis protein CheW [Candidatus Bathyarchaeota archaeon]|nr:chemotaxis protein CheW [Candidatus Bathyarchaeota archaeon]